MKLLQIISDWVVPLTVASILLYGYLKKVDVFSTFTEGAKQGIDTCIGIMPALIALVAAIGAFRSCGALEALTAFVRPLAEKLGFPAEIIPLAMLRPISGSGSLAIYKEIISSYGADSLIGRIASVMQGSTETTFYTIAVYYSAVGIKKTRHTLPSAMMGDITGFIMSALTVRLLLG